MVYISGVVACNVRKDKNNPIKKPEVTPAFLLD